MNAQQPDLIDSTLETIAEVTAETGKRSREQVQADIQRNLRGLRRRPRNIVDAIELAVQADPLKAVAATLVIGIIIGNRR